MIEHMVGRKMEEAFHWLKRSVDRSGTPLLALRDVSRGSKVRHVNLELYRGEVLGVVGLMGSGRTELLQTIFGIYPAEAGEISVKGVKTRITGTEHALRAKIGMIPEDRRVQGLIMDHALNSNVLLPLLSQFTRNGLIKDKKANEKVMEYVKNLNIRAGSIRQPVRSLSGGNQQKVVVAKWLGTDPDILLRDEPTAGGDIAAKTELIALARRLTGEMGKGIILVSSELPELLAVSDRILLLKDGMVTAVMERRDIESEAALHHIIQGN